MQQYFVVCGIFLILFSSLSARHRKAQYTERTALYQLSSAYCHTRARGNHIVHKKHVSAHNGSCFALDAYVFSRVGNSLPSIKLLLLFYKKSRIKCVNALAIQGSRHFPRKSARLVKSKLRPSSAASRHVRYYCTALLSKQTELLLGGIAKPSTQKSVDPVYLAVLLKKKHSHLGRVRILIVIKEQLSQAQSTRARELLWHTSAFGGTLQALGTALHGCKIPPEAAFLTEYALNIICSKQLTAAATLAHEDKGIQKASHSHTEHSPESIRSSPV